ncbi:MAG: hypothetical protein ABIP57_03495 [Jatrophihabitantaceae bacterium]
MAWPPRINWQQLPCFLVDCRTRVGQSGSPVVFFADAYTEFQAIDGKPRRGPAWGLVGAYSGRIHKDSDVGIVWKRPVIGDIIEAQSRPPLPLVPSYQPDPRFEHPTWEVYDSVIDP